MNTLPIPLENIGFVERERRNGRAVTNRCGSDFLYYSLHYYFPSKFSPEDLNPLEIERRGLFGLRLPSWLMWTQLQFMRLPSYLANNGIRLVINGREITSFSALVAAIPFSRMRYKDAVQNIERAVDERL